MKGPDRTNAIRRLGYYVPKPNGTMDAKVTGRPLDAECIGKCVNKGVLDFFPILRAFEIADLSHHELRVALEHVRTQLRDIFLAPAGGIPFVHDAETLMQQRLMSFLSSARSFLDHTKTVIKRLYGDKSSELENFEKHTNRLYDDNFSYRFSNELRNMSQHVSLPVSIFNMNTQRMGRTGPLVYETEFKLDRDHLLTVWNKWKPVIKEDLEKQPPQFDLLPLLDEEMNWLRELCCGVFALREAKIRACLEYLSEQLSRIQTPPNAVPVLWVGESMSNGPPPSVDILPLEQVRRMAKILG